MNFQSLEIASIQKYEKGMEDGYMYGSETLGTIRSAPTLEMAAEHLRTATGHKEIEVIYNYESKKTLAKGYILMPFVWSTPDETDSSKRFMIQIEPGDYIATAKSGKKWTVQERAFFQVYQSALPEQKRQKNLTIENAFTYHSPKDGQPAKYSKLRETAKELAYLIEELCPSSRERSLAMTKLEECAMWANASIARNE